MPDVIIRNAHLCYGNNVLFDNLSLTLVENCWTCLLGPSGVGKSTLLRLLAGLTSIGPGDKLVADIPDAKNIQRQLAYMGQQDGLLPWLTVLENVIIGDKLRQQNIDVDKATQLLAQVNLSAAINKTPEQLSGGMRQRVALARTLYEDRAIVLMDEPFSAVDAITRLRLQELAVTLLKNKTVLFITHDPLEALRVADDIYVMAGCPVSLGDVIQPDGQAPRNLQDQTLLKLQGKLLVELEQGIDN